MTRPRKSDAVVAYLQQQGSADNKTCSALLGCTMANVSNMLAHLIRKRVIIAYDVPTHTKRMKRMYRLDKPVAIVVQAPAPAPLRTPADAVKQLLDAYSRALATAPSPLAAALIEEAFGDLPVQARPLAVSP